MLNLKQYFLLQLQRRYSWMLNVSYMLYMNVAVSLIQCMDLVKAYK